MSRTFVLGISAYYHDSAACLLADGDVVAAASEERFTRVKGDAGFPRHAVEFCLRHNGIEISDVSAVGFYDKPLLKFERILETYLDIAPRGFQQLLKAGPLWIKDKLFISRQLGSTTSCSPSIMSRMRPAPSSRPRFRRPRS